MADLNRYAGIALRVYDKLEDLIPDSGKYPMIRKFPMQKKYGDTFYSTVVTKRPQGFTYSAANAGKTTMEAPSPGESLPLEGRAFNLVLRDELDLESMEKAGSKGPRSFANLMAFITAQFKEAQWARLEQNFINGGMAVATAISGASGVVYSSGTTATISLDPTTFIPNVFHQGEVLLDVWDNNSGTYTLLNTNARVVVTSTSFSGVSSGDIVLTVSGNADDLSAIDTSQSTRAVELWFRGSRTASTIVESYGLRKVAGLTTSDTYKGVAVSDAPYVFQGYRHDCGGSALSFDALEEALMTPATRGARATAKHPWCMLLSYHAMKDLSSDIRLGTAGSAIGVQQNRSGGKSIEVGVESIRLNTPAGPVKLMPSWDVPIGRVVGFIDDPAYIRRVGAVEAKPYLAKMKNMPWQLLEDSTAAQLVSFSHVGLHTTCPRNFIELYNFTVS